MSGTERRGTGAALAPTLRLGLIGEAIDASRAPELHRRAGAMTGRAVRYDALSPTALENSFEGVLSACRAAGYRGVNVTHPYKERAAQSVEIDDSLTRALGAVNTIVFEGERARGFNTDHTGFIAAYRGARGATPPGAVCVIGAGGVGRAAAFALARLGASALRLVDRRPERARAVADAVRAAGFELSVQVESDAAAAAGGADGLINCTPVGMTPDCGAPLALEAMRGASWAFDAVYTPVDTPFLVNAARCGVRTISGFELFLHQGVDAWAIFSGAPLDAAALRAALQDEPARRPQRR